jgi:hypothetical protein
MGSDEFRLADSGTRVEVRSRFDRRWARGFEVVEPIEQPRLGYRIRRRSDRSVLPVVFAAEDVRVERTGTRW